MPHDVVTNIPALYWTDPGFQSQCGDSHQIGLFVISISQSEWWDNIRRPHWTKTASPMHLSVFRFLWQNYRNKWIWCLRTNGLFWVILSSSLQWLIEEITTAVENITKTLAAMMGNFKTFSCTGIRNYIFTCFSIVIIRTLM